MEGLQLDLSWKDLGMLSLEVTPMKVLGASARPMKFRYGNQFQYWQKTSSPVTASIFGQS